MDRTGEVWCLKAGILRLGSLISCLAFRASAWLAVSLRTSSRAQSLAKGGHSRFGTIFPDGLFLSKASGYRMQNPPQPHHHPRQKIIQIPALSASHTNHSMKISTPPYALEDTAIGTLKQQTRETVATFWRDKGVRTYNRYWSRRLGFQTPTMYIRIRNTQGVEDVLTVSALSTAAFCTFLFQTGQSISSLSSASKVGTSSFKCSTKAGPNTSMSESSFVLSL
jgi:hypothetical protein